MHNVAENNMVLPKIVQYMKIHENYVIFTGGWHNVILTLDALGPGLGGGDGLRENKLRKGCINLLFISK